MTTTTCSDGGRCLTAWVSIAGALLAWGAIGFFWAATGGDLTVLFRPAEFLVLPSVVHQQLFIAMLLDCLGF